MEEKLENGFTIVELLVVILIMGVLVSSAFLTLSTVGAAGRKSACVANQRVLAQAIFNYKVDNDDTLPGSTADLDPYLKNPASAAQCPLDKSPIIDFGPPIEISCLNHPETP